MGKRLGQLGRHLELNPVIEFHLSLSSDIPGPGCRGAVVTGVVVEAVVALRLVKVNLLQAQARRVLWLGCLADELLQGESLSQGYVVLVCDDWIGALLSYLNSKIDATFCFQILPCAGSWSKVYLFGTPHFVLRPVLGKRSLCSCLLVV